MPCRLNVATRQKGALEKQRHGWIHFVSRQRARPYGLERTLGVELLLSWLVAKALVPVSVRAARRDFSTCRTAHWQWKDATGSSDPTTGPWQEDVLRDLYHAESAKVRQSSQGKSKSPIDSAMGDAGPVVHVGLASSAG